MAQKFNAKSLTKGMVNDVYGSNKSLFYDGAKPLNTTFTPNTQIQVKEYNGNKYFAFECEETRNDGQARQLTLSMMTGFAANPDAAWKFAEGKDKSNAYVAENLGSDFESAKKIAQDVLDKDSWKVIGKAKTANGFWVYAMEGE